MHDMKNFIRTPMEKLKKLNVGDKMELLTYKKDRKIVIMKKDSNFCDVTEDGFKFKVFENIEYSKLEKLLQDLRKIEFPRSNKFFLRIIPYKN